jgi:hypothetical protein
MYCLTCYDSKIFYHNIQTDPLSEKQKSKSQESKKGGKGVNKERYLRGASPLFLFLPLSFEGEGD